MKLVYIESIALKRSEYLGSMFEFDTEIHRVF